MYMKYLSKGFTLIELLIVIAVLGVLVTAVLVALNPLEQLRRANDSGRINSVSQIGNAVQAFYTAQGATFPTATGGFQTTLKNSGELSNVVTVTAATAGVCAPTASALLGMEGNVCYQADSVTAGAGTDSTVWTVLDSKSEYNRSNCTVALPIPVAVWNFELGKTGIMCVATATTNPGLVLTAGTAANQVK